MVPGDLLPPRILLTSGNQTFKHYETLWNCPPLPGRVLFLKPKNVSGRNFKVIWDFIRKPTGFFPLAAVLILDDIETRLTQTLCRRCPLIPKTQVVAKHLTLIRGTKRLFPVAVSENQTSNLDNRS